MLPAVVAPVTSMMSLSSAAYSATEGSDMLQDSSLPELGLDLTELTTVDEDAGDEEAVIMDPKLNIGERIMSRLNIIGPAVFFVIATLV